MAKRSNKSASAGKTTSLRIIAGIHRGRRVEVPKGLSVRPTLDRARESLFNILMNSYQQADGRPLIVDGLVLDCFAGSGAVGLEALSRGAAQVAFIEHGREAIQALIGNLEPYGNTVKLHTRSALTPPLAPRPATMVFMDPPYEFSEIPQAVAALERTGWIDSATLLVIERDEEREEDEEAGLKLSGYSEIEARKVGRNKFYFLEQAAQG